MTFSPEPNGVVYRLYRTTADDSIVICVQDQDRHDYDSSRFITDDKYETEEAAEAALDIIEAPARKLARIREFAYANLIGVQRDTLIALASDD